MSLTKKILSLTPLAVILLGLLTYNFIGAQWTAPSGTPPAGNVQAPLNTSGTSQIKTGALGTGPLSVTGNALLTSGAPTLELNDTDGRKFWLHNNSGFLYVLADRDGNKSTYEAPYPLILVTDNSYVNDYALFSGKVLASEYCDRNGGNCLASVRPPFVAFTGEISSRNLTNILNQPGKVTFYAADTDTANLLCRQYHNVPFGYWSHIFTADPVAWGPYANLAIATASNGDIRPICSTGANCDAIDARFGAVLYCYSVAGLPAVTSNAI